MAKPEELAWAAGLFDGEGSIGLYYQKAGEQSGKVRMRWTCYLIVCMLDGDCVKRFYEIVGEGSVTRRKRNTSFHSGRMWEWKASCLQADRVLEQILPYLVSKRNQAEMFKEFRGLPRSTRKSEATNPLKFSLAAQIRASKRAVA